jgi:histidine triad (HIT) family protein
MIDNCIFCKIAKGEIPSTKIYEDENIISFLDINPSVKGHALVVPKKHFENIYDVDDETLKNIVSVAKKIALKQKEALKCDGGNIFLNVNRSGGQLVPHIHMHVVPRYDDDGKELKFSSHDKYFEKEMKTYSEKLKID